MVSTDSLWTEADDCEPTDSPPHGVAFPKSLWAAVTADGPTYHTLDGEAEADVVVVGGGLSGLAAALHLAESGVSVAVIEAVEPGWGAAGRNNGQVIPTLTRHDPDDIVARDGEAGERFVGLLRNSAQHGVQHRQAPGHRRRGRADRLGAAGPLVRPHAPGRAARGAVGEVWRAGRAADPRPGARDDRLGRLARRLAEPLRRPRQPAGAGARPCPGGDGRPRPRLRQCAGLWHPPRR